MSPKFYTFAASLLLVATATTAMAASPTKVITKTSSPAPATPAEPTVDQILAMYGTNVGTNTFQVSTQTFDLGSLSDPFGFYMDHEYVNPDGSKRGGTWYTQSALDSDGHQHVEVFQEQGTDNDFLAFEDHAYPKADGDFNDLVVEYNLSTGTITKLASYAGAAPDTTFGYYDTLTGVKTPLWTDSVPNGTVAHLAPVPEANSVNGLGFGCLALLSVMACRCKKNLPGLQSRA